MSSWLFGSNNKTEETNIKQTLGFDPNEISDVNKIISSPSTANTHASLLHPLAGLDKGVEYLDLEEEQLNTVEGSKGLIPSRSWSDDLGYGTGAVYLMGLGVGGLFGLQEGINTLQPNQPSKVKLNHILNSITKRGPFVGNNAGVLALTYNIIDSSIDALREKHDDANSIVSGALAGALFKSSAGLKPMAISSIVMATAAGSWCGIKRLLQ